MILKFDYMDIDFVFLRLKVDCSKVAYLSSFCIVRVKLLIRGFYGRKKNHKFSYTYIHIYIYIFIYKKEFGNFCLFLKLGFKKPLSMLHVYLLMVYKNTQNRMSLNEGNSHQMQIYLKNVKISLL